MNISIRVFVFLIAILFSAVFNNAFAKQESIEIRLQEIEEIDNKSEAIFQLKTLLKESELTIEQHLNILTIIGWHYHGLGNLNQAILNLTEAQQLAAANNLEKQQAESYKLIGVFNYYKGNFAKALTAYEASLQYYLKSNEIIKRAHLYNNIGLVQNNLGNPAQALKTYKIADEIYQHYGSTIDKIDIRFNISGIYLTMKRYDHVIQILPQIIKQRQEIKDFSGVALARSDLAIAYKSSGNFLLAEEQTLAALRFYQQENMLYDLASQFNNIADLYNEVGKIELAIDYAKQCIALSQDQQHDGALANCYHELGRGYFYLGHFEKASKNTNISNELAMKFNYKLLLNNNLALMSLIHAGQNKPQQALAKFRAYRNEQQKIYNDILNDELATFESEQLVQQVEQLQQAKELQAVQNSKNQLNRNFTVVAVALILLILFLLYRRNKEVRTKKLLARQVKERTEELELTSKELQEANKIKSQFLANMSHEIRTPLTAVIGLSESIINDEVATYKIKDDVNVIHTNSLHLLQLVNDILDISKIEAEKLELDVKCQNIDVIINDLTNMFAEQARVKGLQFIVVNQLSPGFLINIDALRLNQILINFCSNAIKFTSVGEVKLEIKVVQDKLIFAVSDTGIGMNKGQIKKIFDSFVQGDSSISRRFGGTGLGLFLSGQLATIMNGKIEVESALNQGSCFTFSCPFSAAINQLPTTHELSIEESILDNTLTGTILLAEDHPDNRRLILRLLVRMGLNVITAINGRQAIEKYNQFKPDAILMDIQMPDIDGIEAFKEIRKQGSMVPVIALTANAMSHEIEGYLSLGFDSHLKKPIDRKQFVATLNKYFAKKSTEDVLGDPFLGIDISDLIQDFKGDLLTEKNNLEQHLSELNIEALLMQSHRLAGAAAMFGFPEISDLAIKLESSIKQGKQQAIIDNTRQLITEINTIIAVGQQ